MKTAECGGEAGILVWIQMNGRQVHPASVELLGEAKRLAASLSPCPVMAAVVGEKAGVAEQLDGYPVDQVLVYEIVGIDRGDIMALSQILIDAIEKLRPAVVLVPATAEGRAVAPRAAAVFHTGITADCTRLELTGEGRLIQIRPAFGGNVMAEIETPSARPQMATVRPGLFPVPPRDTNPPYWRTETVVLEQNTGLRILNTKPLEEQADLNSCDCLLVIGAGVRNKEDVGYFRELAAHLNAGLGCSRALVEKGWMKPEQQIGLSGSVVRPKFMLCLGISGSVQFMTGAVPDYLAAVNTDPAAPILQKAHSPIVADLYEVAAELVRRPAFFTQVDVYKNGNDSEYLGNDYNGAI